MSGILALLPSIISLLPLIETGVGQLVALIGSIRSAAQQSQEWTPELEAAFVNGLIALATKPEQQPDAPTK